MKQWLRSMMLLSVPVMVWGCKSDQTVGPDAGVAAKLVATPTRVFVNQDGSEPVVVTSVDAEGRPVPTTFTLTPPSDPGITVTLDTTHLLVYNAEGVAVAPTGTASARYQVAASTFTTSSFTVTSAEGKSVTIQVDATPATLPATFSKTAVNLGDTITITAPAGTFFRSTSSVTFASGMKPIVVDVAADSNSIRVIPGPNDAGVATITDLGIRYNDALKFTAPTTTGITSTPPIVSAGTVSPDHPALGETITVTVPAGTGTRFLPTSKVFFADSTNLAKQVTLAADSQSISFIAPPNQTEVKVSVTQVINTNLPQPEFQQTLGTDNTLTTPTIAAFSGTLSTTTPAAGQQVTLTGNPGFKISPSASVSIGGQDAVTIGVSADSSVLTFVAKPGSSGAVVLTGTVAGGFALGPLPTGLSLTAANGAITAVAGTDAFATAPTLTMADGKTVGVASGAPFGFDASNDFGGNAQLYKFTLTQTTDITVKIPFASSGADLGAYFYDASFNALGGAVDAKGGGAGNAESGVVTLDAGTYYVAVVYFQYSSSPTAPDAYGIQMTPVPAQ